MSVVAAMLPSTVIDAMESMLANDATVSPNPAPQYVSQGVSADLDSELKVSTSPLCVVSAEYYSLQNVCFCGIDKSLGVEKSALSCGNLHRQPCSRRME